MWLPCYITNGNMFSAFLYEIYKGQFALQSAQLMFNNSSNITIMFYCILQNASSEFPKDKKYFFFFFNKVRDSSAYRLVLYILHCSLPNHCKRLTHSVACLNWSQTVLFQSFLQRSHLFQFVIILSKNCFSFVFFHSASESANDCSNCNNICNS